MYCRHITTKFKNLYPRKTCNREGVSFVENINPCLMCFNLITIEQNLNKKSLFTFNLSPLSFLFLDRSSFIFSCPNTGSSALYQKFYFIVWKNYTSYYKIKLQILYNISIVASCNVYLMRTADPSSEQSSFQKNGSCHYRYKYYTNSIVSPRLLE